MSSILEAIRLTPRSIKPVIPTISTGPRRDQNGINKNFWEGLEKEQLDLRSPDQTQQPSDNKKEIIITLPASSHTNINLPDNTVAHLLVWVNASDKTPGIASVPENYIEELAYQITLATNYLVKNSEDGQKPIIYSLSGFTEKNNPLGLSPGAQTNPLPHVHVVIPPKKEVEIELTPEQSWKFHAPINNFLDSILKPFVNSIKKSSDCPFKEFELELIYQENTNNILPGLKISIQGSVSLADYLLLMRFFGNYFNDFYQYLMNEFKKIYCTSDIDQKQKLIEQLKKYLISEKNLDEKTASALIEFSLLFNPTLRQIENWLKDSQLNDEDKKRLEGKESIYIKRKKNLQQNETTFKEKLKRLFGLNDSQVEILIQFLSDQLISENEDKQPRFTLSENFSWGFLIDDYQITSDGQLQIKNIKIFPLLISLGSNIMETYADVILERKQ